MRRRRLADWRRRAARAQRNRQVDEFNDPHDLSSELSKLYGFPLDVTCLRRRLDAVGVALAQSELARAQIAALMLQLPDPPASAGAEPDALEEQCRVRDLVACAFAESRTPSDWDDKHPTQPARRQIPVGSPRRRERREADGTKTSPNSGAPIPSHGGETLAFAPPAAGVGSLLAENLSTTALRGLAVLAARFSAATILLRRDLRPEQQSAGSKRAASLAIPT